MEILRVKTTRRTQLVDVTDEVEQAVAKAGVESGVCYVYVPHTTAGVTINEHFDPDVATDLEGVFERLVPRPGPYRHSEGNSDSHAKEFPSLCLYGPGLGTKRSNTPSKSVATSGSKCSLIVTPAVVCGTYT